MLWTIFKVFAVVWMLQLVLRFGGNAVQLAITVSLAALLLQLCISLTSFNAGRLRYFAKTGRPNAMGNSPAP
jgi:hypothetical protein